MLGPVFKQLRHAKKQTQQALAKKAGISQAAISQLEKDDGYSPSWATVIALATALNVDLLTLRDLEKQEAKYRRRKAK